MKRKVGVAGYNRRHMLATAGALLAVSVSSRGAAADALKIGTSGGPIAEILQFAAARAQEQGLDEVDRDGAGDERYQLTGDSLGVTSVVTDSETRRYRTVKRRLKPEEIAGITVSTIATPRYLTLLIVYPFLIQETTGTGLLSLESRSSAWISWNPKKRR